jgi:hypothetical protein
MKHSGVSGFDCGMETAEFGLGIRNARRQGTGLGIMPVDLLGALL